MVVFIGRNPNLFWTKSGLRNSGLSRPAAAHTSLAVPQKKFSSQFFILRAPDFFFLKGKENFFAGLCSERAGRRGFTRLGRGGIPPTPPSAAPSLGLAENFAAGLIIISNFYCFFNCGRNILRNPVISLFTIVPGRIIAFYDWWQFRTVIAVCNVIKWIIAWIRNIPVLIFQTMDINSDNPHFSHSTIQQFRNLSIFCQQYFPR